MAAAAILENRKIAIFRPRFDRFRRNLTQRHSFTPLNVVCVLYPGPLTWQKEFLLFYMCQLWALHVFIKRQFFAFIVSNTYCSTASVSTHILQYFRCYVLHNGIAVGLLIMAALWFLLLSSSFFLA